MARLLARCWRMLPWLALLAVPLGAQGQEQQPREPARSAAPTTVNAFSLPAPARVRQAVARSLPFLEKEGLAWMEERKCIACHHAPFLLWSHNEARRQGFPIEPRKIDAWTSQALGLYLAKQQENETKKNGCVEATNLLLGQVASADPAAEPLRTVSALLVNGQQEDGFWKYEGQGQKRPDSEANEATTLWAILALTAVEKTDPAYA